MQEKREQIFQMAIEDEMKTSYIDYAMSVIVGRALPDVRDGLKPVHRRIIYAMNELGLAPNRPFMKCARIVGETMGKYHPHGDAAIYDTLVRLAQVFSCRYPLINGQGNFGSVDGDPPAAMRYTEARMARFSELLLNDIDRRTVDFRPNYDGRNMEPDVLPAAFPNLLVNGSSGIAVGMANNIPPHNLGEVIDATIMLIDAPETTIEQMLEVLPGPDFPTGGFIVGRAGIKKAYATGRGSITIRARMQTEQLKHGKEAIVITEIPYQVNKSKLQEDIARLIKEKKIQGITDMRDESDRDGMRVVLELKKDEIPQVVINQLLKHTQLQITFGIILLALVDGRPRYMSLKKILQYYIDHRVEVVTRRTQFELEKAEARLHIVDGLVIALDNLDAVINLIRKAKMVDEAREKLMAKFGLSQIQAQAILDMRLQRLTGLEREKIMNEKKDLEKLIKHLMAILEDSKKVLKIVKSEMLEIKEKFNDPRRSEIIDADTELSLEDLIAEERMIITISHQGYIKRTPTYLYRRQNRGGKGIYGMATKEEDWAEHIFIGTTHNYLLCFTSEGRAYWLKVYELPQAGRATRGRPIVNMLQLQTDETVKGMIPVSKFDDDHFLVMATKKGMIIKNALSLYKNPRKGGVKAVKIAKDDELVEVKLTNGQQEIFIGSSNGMAVRFHESDTRPTGRFTGGVIGIRLAKDAEVVGMAACHPNASILTVCENGYGKRTSIDQYRLIKRGGKGVINIKTTERNGNVVTVKQVFDNDELIMITQKGMTIRSPIATIRTISRNTQGVRLINLEKGDKITSVAWIEEQKEEAIEEEEGAKGETNGDEKNEVENEQ